jgi:hypothetical protein
MESSLENCPNFFVSQSSSAVGAFFGTEDDLVFCYGVDGLMNALGIKHDPQEWRLFIDSSKMSMEAVLLHNANQHPSIPVGNAVHRKHQIKSSGGTWPTTNSDLIAKYSHAFSRFMKSTDFNKLQ